MQNQEKMGPELGEIDQPYVRAKAALLRVVVEAGIETGCGGSFLLWNLFSCRLMRKRKDGRWSVDWN